jgi:hypothetical protein
MGVHARETSRADALSSSLEGDGARIPMTDEGVLALLRVHFTGASSMHLCPSIPGRKEIVARAIHARHLPSEERVLALFDDTIFGSGDEGFLITSQRVCWKNPGTTGRPESIEWRHVDPDTMYADRGRIVIGVGAIAIAGDESTLATFEAVFHVLAFSAHAHARALAATGGSEVARKLSDRPTFRPSRPPTAPPPLESEVVPRSDRRPPSDVADAPPRGGRSGR